MTTVDQICRLSTGVLAEAVDWRRDLHRHPELAYAEHRTSDFVSSKLESFGLEVHKGLAGTGVVGTLRRGSRRRAIGIRADMDALPIAEATDVPYRSVVPGVMHACGHDGHVAILLAAARLSLQLNDLDGDVHFIFQPAEELERGGQKMIAAGLFDKFPCDAVFALHNWPSLPMGQLVVLDGPMMAAMGVFEVRIEGPGCHGAMPHQGSDCLLAASHIVVALQSIVSRNVEPNKAAVISVTRFHGGTSANVIPDSCAIGGTSRWFDSDVGDMLETRLHQLTRSIAESFGCHASVQYERRVPATINDRKLASSLRAIASRSFEVVDECPSMGAEDFGFMLEKVPGCYAWLGAKRGDREIGLHSSKYDFNDDLLQLGVRLWLTVINKWLGHQKSGE